MVVEWWWNGGNSLVHNGAVGAVSKGKGRVIGDLAYNQAAPDVAAVVVDVVVDVVVVDVVKSREVVAS